MVKLKVKKKAAIPVKKEKPVKKIKIKVPYVDDETILVRIGKTKDFTPAQIVKIDGPKITVKYLDNDIIEKYGNGEFVYALKDAKKLKLAKEKPSIRDPRAQKVVSPVFWVLQNKKMFPQWINETFIKYKITDKTDISKVNKTFKPYGYQLFLRDYMQNSSPYRGVLLYHSLGSGKSCSAIMIAENLKLEKNVIVISPATLKDNFINDGLLFCGDPAYQRDPKLIEEKYSFISGNASNTIQQIKSLGTLDNKVIIIDEVHNLVSRMVGGLNGENKQGKDIYNALMEARDCKIIALTGTPIVNATYEAGILFNVLRGYMYLTIFAIKFVGPEYGVNWNLQRLEETLGKMDEVDYLETNKVNKTMEFHLTMMPWHPQYQDIIKAIIDQAKKLNVELEYLTYKAFTLFPDGEGETADRDFRNYFVDETDPRGDKMKNKELFKRRILGLTSYYKSKIENFPSVKYHPMIRIDMSPYQLTEYMSVRGEEKKSRQLAEIRVFTRQYSNFVFPPEIPRPGIGQKIAKKAEENENLAKVIGAVESVEKADIVKAEEIKKYQKAVDAALEELKKGSDQYLVKNRLGTYSPKMKAILENMEKTKGLVFVYSDFRSLEGVGIFALILEANGYSKYGSADNKPKYAMYTGSEDFEERSIIKKIFKAPENKYGKNLKVLLATSAGTEGLDLKNIRQVHIMEPYWNEVRIQQVVGRAVRRNSHIDLPKNEQNVEVYRYLSVISEKDQEKLKPKDRTSTDEAILEIAKKKEYITNEMLEVLKESAVDCVLNAFDNERGIKCFSFGQDIQGLAYLPRLSRDFGRGIEYATREVEQKLRIGGIGDNNLVYFVENKKLYLVTDITMRNPIKKMPKIRKRVALDLKKKEVFDYDISKTSGSKVKLGEFNQKGEFYKI